MGKWLPSFEENGFTIHRQRNGKEACGGRLDMVTRRSGKRLNRKRKRKRGNFYLFLRFLILEAGR